MISVFLGAVSLLQIQEEQKKYHEENKVEDAIKTMEEKKDIMIKSLWQINVVDIELTLSRVCQAVSTVNSSLSNSDGSYCCSNCGRVLIYDLLQSTDALTFIKFMVQSSILTSNWME